MRGQPPRRSPGVPRHTRPGPLGPRNHPTACWSGVGLADVLAEAGLQAEAGHIAFTGTDVSQEADPPKPYGGSIPMARATSSEVLLAWTMNGQTLPVARGAPLPEIALGMQLKHFAARGLANRSTRDYAAPDTAWARHLDDAVHAARFRRLKDLDGAQQCEEIGFGPGAERLENVFDQIAATAMVRHGDARLEADLLEHGQRPACPCRGVCSWVRVVIGRAGRRGCVRRGRDARCCFPRL
ncbi:molybdopterin-dependent oxidoreductase [Actinacidiphila oryziradicis]|uniref:molybdopterin-dependent oxidoreductase n=1 Tax=Actinacidiphila oryziradicis TaxID=2571141 RepID=UPI0022471496|nr:molybdopterin-dependent oxidoreductase [Actinacidiphila oryziradicis]